MKALFIYLFGFSIPFYTFGIHLIDSIWISFPLIAFYIFTIFFILSGHFSQRILFFILLLNLYIFLTTFVRVPLLEFIFAFVAFFISTLSLSINFERNPVFYSNFIKGFIGAAWVTIVLILLSFLSLFVLNESQMYLLEPLGYKINYGMGFFGLTRPTIFFLEPANLAMYLVCVFVVTSFSVSNVYDNTILNKLSFLAIIITGSLAGIIILSVFILIRKNLIPNYRTILLAIIAVTLLYIFAQDSEFYHRLYRAFTTFTTHDYGGSEGQRIGTMRIPYDMIKDGNIIVTLFGSGFSDYSRYLQVLYADSIIGSAFRSGNVANSIVVYFVSVGILGFLFTLYVFSLIFRANHMPKSYVLTIILIMSSYGTFINYLLWVLILILMKINIQSVSKYIDPSCNPHIFKSRIKLSK